VPLDVGGQRGGLVQQLLDVVLPKAALAGVVRLTHGLRWLGLADRDEPGLVGVVVGWWWGGLGRCIKAARAARGRAARPPVHQSKHGCFPVGARKDNGFNALSTHGFGAPSFAASELYTFYHILQSLRHPTLACHRHRKHLVYVHA